jgi:osmotically-inducible protein OsmY
MDSPERPAVATEQERWKKWEKHTISARPSKPGYPQYLEAAAAAQRVTGVKNVHNHLEVVLSDDDYRDDAMLTTSANNALTLNILVPDEVEATAVDGNTVTLTGHVRAWAEHDAAVSAAWMAGGVFEVRDDLAITG